MKHVPLIVVSLSILSCNLPEPVASEPADLAFTCVSPETDCDHPDYSMAVLGDEPTCEVMGPGSLRLELASSDNDEGSILVAFEGYDGPGTYALDDPARDFIHVDDGVDIATCSGTIHDAKRVTAGDPSCPSPACEVEVADEAPDAPFPRPLTFTVHCESLCENGGDVVCAGPFDFVARAECG